MESFAFESLRTDCGRFADVVDGYFEERGTSFEDLPNRVHDTVRFGDCTPFGFMVLGYFHCGEEERADDDTFC